MTVVGIKLGSNRHPSGAAVILPGDRTGAVTVAVILPEALSALRPESSSWTIGIVGMVKVTVLKLA